MTDTTTTMPAVTTTGSTPFAPNLTPPHAPPAPSSSLTTAGTSPSAASLSGFESAVKTDLAAEVVQLKSVLRTLVDELAAGASNAVPKTQAKLEGWIDSL